MALTKCKECGNEVSTKADACPKCGAKIKRTRPAFKVIGVLLLGLFAIAIFAPDSNTSTPSQAAQQLQPEFSTTARDMAAAYNENTVSADNKFKGHRFTIEGTATDINTDFTGSAVIVLNGGINEFLQPQATIADADKQKAASISKGAVVTLACTGEGDVAKSPQMKDCVIQ